MNKNYLIFGASSEIGLALANELAKVSQAKLLLISRTHTIACDKLASKHEHIEYHSNFDLTDAEIEPVLQELICNYFESTFHVINLMGDFWQHIPFEEVSLENGIKMIESHLITAYTAAHIVFPIMRERNGGSFVTFSCNSVRYSYPYMTSFTSSKAGVEALTKCLAHEYGQYGVKVNGFRLASVATKAVVASKPYGDVEHFMNTSDVVKEIRNLCEVNSIHFNGNIIELYKHSNDFYGKGYYERVRT